MSNNSRPDIEEALDLRSNEHIVVLSAADNDFQYKPEWVAPQNTDELQESLNADSIVVVDRVDVSDAIVELIASVKPRLVAFAVQPANIEHEKTVRRQLTALFPWHEVWTISTSFGKLLVSKDVQGKVYDRAAD